MADEGDARDANRRQGKSAAAFRTISEVATDLDVPPHVLRFWESKFTHVKPLKRGGGRRYYRPEDIELLRGIRELLYTDGYTIKGVQKLLRDGGVKSVLNGASGDAAAPDPRPEAVPSAETGPSASPLPRAVPVSVPPASAPSAALSVAPAAPVPPISAAKRAALRDVLADLEDLRDLLQA